VTIVPPAGPRRRPFYEEGRFGGAAGELVIEADTNPQAHCCRDHVSGTA
jgi:hypothetical protein